MVAGPSGSRLATSDRSAGGSRPGCKVPYRNRASATSLPRQFAEQGLVAVRVREHVVGRVADTPRLDHAPGERPALGLRQLRRFFEDVRAALVAVRPLALGLGAVVQMFVLGLGGGQVVGAEVE